MPTRSEVLVALPGRAGMQAPAATAIDVTNGHYFQNPDGRELLIIKNPDAAPHTLTLRNPTLVEGAAVPDRTFSIPAGQTWYIPGPSPSIFDQPGTVVVNFDADYAMTLNIVRLPQ